MHPFHRANFLYIAFAFVFVFGCKNPQPLVIDCAHAEIEYAGRIDASAEEGVDLIWSGTAIKMQFEGRSISALFEDENGDNYYNVLIDDDSLFVFRPDTTKEYHQLATDLPKGKHSIEIFKRTEWNRGKTTFYGFKIEGDAKILPKPAPRQRQIEFYGNSITAGYAVEDTSGRDSPDSTYTNNYLSYAAITARHFDADYHCICKSGIGITVSWFPLIMPEIYDRTDPNDPDSKWDFSLYSPDIVVINLLQNDSWIVHLPEFEEFQNRFGSEAPDDAFIINAYQQFVANIRTHYPGAHIICSLGCMDAAQEDSEWMDYIEEAVANLNDEKIHTHFMPYIEATAHPSISDHEEMASSLIDFIAEHIDW